MEKKSGSQIEWGYDDDHHRRGLVLLVGEPSPHRVSEFTHFDKIKHSIFIPVLSEDLNKTEAFIRYFLIRSFACNVYSLIDCFV